MILHPRPRGNFVSQDEFLGRKNLLAELDAAFVGGGAKIQVNGPRRIGKTWALACLRERAKAEGGVHVVELRLDALGDRTPGRFYALVGEALRRAVPDFAGAVHVNGTRSPVEEGVALIDTLQDLSDMEVRLLLLVDEFEKLAATPAFDTGFFDQLRVAAETPNVSFVLATARPLREVCHADAVGSTFWGIFQKAIVRPWCSKETTEAVRTWWAGRMDCPDDAFCTALHEVSGGWPVVAAQACKILLRDDGPAPSAKALRELEFELAEQFGDEVRHALDHAGARCGASPSDFRSLVRAGSMRSQDLPAEALEALTQVGLAVQDGQRVRPAWPFARQVVELIGGSRTAAFTTRSPPTWEEWRQLGALRPVPKNAPERVRRALVEVRSGPHPRHAWFACRELVDALFGWLAAHVPPAGLHDGDHPRPFSERRNRKEKLAHMRQAGRAGPDGLDPRLAKMLDALSKAEEFGAHHDGLDLEPLEGAAFLLLAEATTRRAGDWVAGRRG